MNNEKRVVLLSLTILALLLTGFTWAYWNAGEVKGASINNYETNTVKVGAAEKVDVETKVEIKDITLTDNALVPPKFVDKDKNLDSSITKQVDINWQALSDNELVDGTVGELRNIKIEIVGYDLNAIDNPNKLFSIDGPGEDKIFPVYLGTNHKNLFEVTINFVNEPTDQIEYEALQKQGVKLKISAELVVVKPAN